MVALTRKFPNKVVYFESSGVNKFGESTVEAGREISVRLEEKVEDTLTSAGELVRTNHTMYVQEDLKDGSFIWVGELANLPSPIKDVLEVISFEKIPNYNGKKFERTVKLRNYKDSIELT